MEAVRLLGTVIWWATADKSLAFSINVCDRPEMFDKLQEEYKDTSVTVMRDGHHVSRISDFIIYSVEASLIDQVVAMFGPCECVKKYAQHESIPHPFSRSYETRLNRLWPNVCQSARKGRL